MSTDMYSEWIKPYIDTYHSFIMVSYSVMNVQLGELKYLCFYLFVIASAPICIH